MSDGYLTPEELTRFAGELADVQSRIITLTRVADGLKERIRQGVPRPDTYQAGPLRLVVSTNYRLDEKAALRNMPPEVRPLVVRLVEKVDSEKLKLLAPETYWASVTNYAPRVSVS